MIHFDFRRMRKNAYRSVVFFLRGRLGEGVRIVVPACVKDNIRKMFPNPEGEAYTGHFWK